MIRHNSHLPGLKGSWVQLDLQRDVRRKRSGPAVSELYWFYFLFSRASKAAHQCQPSLTTTRWVATEVACCFQTNNAVLLLLSTSASRNSFTSSSPSCLWSPRSFFVVYQFRSLTRLSCSGLMTRFTLADKPPYCLRYFSLSFLPPPPSRSFCLMCSDLQAWLLSGSTAH